MPPPRPSPSAPLPNWALGLGLTAFVGGTYAYVLAAVGKSDVDAAIEEHQRKEKAKAAVNRAK